MKPDSAAASVSEEDGVDGDEKLDSLRAQEAYWKSVEHTYRHKWWQIWRPGSPPPPPVDLDDADDIPIAHANILSLLTFTWITPVLVIGWQRPLQVIYAPTA